MVKTDKLNLKIGEDEELEEEVELMLYNPFEYVDIFITETSSLTYSLVDV